METLQEKLEQVLAFDYVENAAVCEFSSEDSTPTLHIHFWRKFDLGDLPWEIIRDLDIISEGWSDIGPVYSLQPSKN